PKLLVMDEPTEGLAPVIVEQVERMLVTLAAEGEMAILVIEQNIGVATTVSDRVAIMVNGRIHRVMEAKALAADRDLQQRLLGVGRHAEEAPVTPAEAAEAQEQLARVYRIDRTGDGNGEGAASDGVYRPVTELPNRWNLPVTQMRQAALEKSVPQDDARKVFAIPFSERIGRTVLVVGTFDTVTTSMPFIDLGVIYSGTGVDLNVARNGKAFASSARTDNQRAVADAVEGLGSGMIYDAVVASASDAAARASFDSLSGEIYPSLATAGIETDTMLRGILIERALEQPADVGGNGLWGRPYRLNATLLSNGNAADVNQRTWGVIGGADGDIDDIWKLGVAAGYGRSNIDVPDRASSAKIDTLSLAAYASWEAARWRGAFGALYSWHDISANRFVTAGTFEDATDVNYRARSGQIFGQVDYRVAISNWILDPFLNVAYARWDADGFSEHGGDAALTARSSSVDGLVGTAGLRVGTEVALDHGVAARLGATAGWRLSSIGDSETLMSIAGSDPFFIGGVPVERSVAVLGLEAGLVYRNTSFGLAYTGLL
ncbi:MAG: autotransporter domain-containing protein, partial [Mesorhizobium sp.]|nr:autotransporter domain-containing protein [Mesorhizobium sp.]